MLATSWLRRTDLFALLGILMLAAWAPGYAASDPEDRARSDEASFDLPPPRIGDRMEQSLVLWKRGDDAVRLGPLLIVERDRPRNGDCPEEAVMVERREFVPVNVSLGWTQVVRDGKRDQICYDGDGTPIWYAREGRHWSPYYPHLVGGAQHLVPSDRFAQTFETVRWADGQLLHSASPIRAVGAEALESLGALMGLKDEGDLMFSKGVAHVEGRALYEGRRSSEEWLPFGGSDPVRPHGPREKDSTFRMTAGLLDGAPLPVLEDMEIARYGEWWVWVAPDWPTPVGEHRSWTGPDGEPAVRIDLVPTQLVRGDGPVVEVRKVPDRWGTGSLHPLRPLSVREDVPLIPLNSLQSIDAPLYRGESLKALVAHVRTEGPTAANALLAEGGHLAGFAFLGRPTTRHLNEDPALLPIPVQEPTYTEHTEEVTFWGLLFAKEDVTQVVFVQANRTSEGDRVLVSWDPCVPGEEHWWPAGIYTMCETLETEQVAPDRLVVDPRWFLQTLEETRSDLIARAAAANLTFPERFAYVPGYAVDDDDPRLALYAGTPYLKDLTGAEAVQSMHPFDGFVTWSLRVEEKGLDRWGRPADESWAGSWHLPTGQTVYERHHDGADFEPSRPFRPLVSAASTTEPLDHQVLYATTAATAGLVLILVSVLARLVGAFKSGAHVGIVAPLFSRISKDKALLHERRSDIFQLLEAEPGMTAKEIADRLGLGWGVTAHHLEKLVSNGLLEATRNGQHRHYFLAGLAPHERLRLAVTRDPVYAAFLDHVEAAPGLTLGDLLPVLPQRKSGASRTGSRLAALGLLDKRRDGRAVRFYPAAPKGRRHEGS